MDTYVCKRCENTGTCIVSLLEALIKHSTMADIKASERNVIFMKILQLTFSNVPMASTNVVKNSCYYSLFKSIE